MSLLCSAAEILKFGLIYSASPENRFPFILLKLLFRSTDAGHVIAPHSEVAGVRVFGRFPRPTAFADALLCTPCFIPPGR